uniref:Uncharacterized protein n=1 Tax=Arundo donax TaxID=35708 RepID=A0A0A9D9D3_ARUDO
MVACLLQGPICRTVTAQQIIKVKRTQPVMVVAIVTGIGVDVVFHYSGMPSQFEGRGRTGSTSHLRLGRRSLAAGSCYGTRLIKQQLQPLRYRAENLTRFGVPNEHTSSASGHEILLEVEVLHMTAQLVVKGR